MPCSFFHETDSVHVVGHPRLGILLWRPHQSLPQRRLREFDGLVRIGIAPLLRLLIVT